MKIYYKTDFVCSLLRKSDEQIHRVAKELGIKQKRRGKWHIDEIEQLIEHWYPHELINGILIFYSEIDKIRFNVY